MTPGRQSPIPRAALAALLTTGLSCGAAPAPTIAIAAPARACTPPRPPRLFVRLTADEYDATVRDLLVEDAHASSELPREEDPLDLEAPLVSPALAAAYLRSAEGLAERAVAARLDALAPCVAAGDGSEACAREVVERLGRRAYRRPLTGPETERLLALEERGGVRLLLVGLLTSPHFLYRVERGEQLEPYERASRLSYFLWGSMPDDALLDAAAAGALDTPDALEAQARRMLADPRARPHLARFVARWLELSVDDVTRDETAYPEWGPALARSADASSARFVEHVLFDGTGTLDELFTAPYAFVDDALAPLFGVAPPGGAGLVRVALDPRERAGILTQPAFLAAHASPDASSPALRGRALRERLFCQPLPSPPDDVVPLAAADASRPTTRARFEAHVADERCASCHGLMDPLGFALERYDAIGRYREREHDVPVDPRGEITDTRASDGAVADGIALAHVLARSDDVARCVTERSWRLALRRAPDDDDACERDALDDAWERSGGRLDALFVAIVRSDAFAVPGRSP